MSSDAPGAIVVLWATLLAVTRPEAGAYGLTSNITITSTGVTAIDGWSLLFTLPDGQTITSGWNAGAAASAELPAAPDGDGAEDRRAGTREGARHGGAVAEPQGEALCRVDAQVPSIRLSMSSTKVPSFPPVLAQPLSRPCGATKTALLSASRWSP
ncbi:cellulose binding domain-containing protein [Streptomyces pharetrae]|uniref:cellulose binding domain-containing protein n=1 Tax=Streptomyces pharetrae TaxID=291370 RepID=UPI0038503DA1